MARGVFALLGEAGSRLLQADRANIWAVPRPALEIDFEGHEEALKAALAMAPSQARDDHLVAALAEDGTLLVDEPYADWALPPRERLEGLRQQARIVLARDRAIGAGRTGLEAVVDAWESCLDHDPASEEAAAALVRAYQAQGSRQLVVRTYERCRAALEELGLRPSPALESVHVAVALGQTTTNRLVSPALWPENNHLVPVREERRVVTVLFAEVTGGREAVNEELEHLGDLMAEVLGTLIAAVESFGGTVTSVSGAGVQALFGAPEAHEDDPERAVRAALSSLRATADLGPPALRIGVETGPAIVGPVHSAVGFHYRAVGAVAWAAAALQSVARAGSALIGPVTRATTEGVFEWGTTEEVGLEKGGRPPVGAYVEGLKPRAPSGQQRFAGRSRLVGRAVELSSLTEALKDTEGGSGSVVTLVGEPGLGKTRLVQECRKRFMAWAGARSGRLPLWLEGRCASYASTTPYGLYQHVLGSLAGVTPGQEEGVVGPALKRALLAAMGNRELWPLLARMMNLPGGASTSGLGPYDLQRATFSALKAIVARLARAGPTVLALEDLHWADATSLRLTGEVAPLALQGPLLVLLTRRPHPDPGVSDLEQGL
ncbi:MAG TPA: AAA family ATPase, partial [Acidimicrobiales bacterium]|nr:AAA family ATPase [Acidimicrobiales bacterium]